MAQIWDSSASEWPALGVSPEGCDALRQLLGGLRNTDPSIEESLEHFSVRGVEMLPICSDRYPVLLRTIADPPPLLYCLGDPTYLNTAQLAVVGSRRASAGGLRAAREFSSRAVAAGLSITSGLALGIDGAAHQAALDADGVSVAVVATGIDRCYPARHRGLAEELVAHGCIVTEFAPGSPPLRGHFPRRNRLISGMSLGVLVVEAALPSGSLITANIAGEQGREVFAIPWSPLHPGGRGCLQLIRDGAKMVRDIDDIVEELGPVFELQVELGSGSGSVSPPQLKPTGGDGVILTLIGSEEIGTDELATLAALPVAQVLAELTALELSGVIERGPGGYTRA